MFKSIKWKFITIYILLVFIAMVISGVFITKSYESYYLNEINEQLDDVSNVILPLIDQYDNIDNNKERIQESIKTHIKLGLKEEIFVISATDTKVIAATTENIRENILNLLEYDLIAQGLTGDVSYKESQVNTGIENVVVYDKVYPIVVNNEIKGALYIRYNLNEIYSTLSNSQMIILKATLLALFITVVIGYLISRSITGPINDVTEKAYEMSKGNFDQHVDVMSDDEIGKLAEMFNFLTQQLKSSVNEISEEKSKLEAIIDNMADGLLAIHENGEIMHYNPRLKEILGINNDDRLYLSNVKSKLKGAVNFSVGQSYKVETTIDGAIYQIKYVPINTSDDRKIGSICVFQDITEQQRLENMRRDFVANVSHELKTPLTSIKSYTETLLSGAVDDDETQKNFLEVIFSESNRMNRLVRDLLQLTNMDSKSIEMNHKTNDYIELISNSLKKLEIPIKKKNHTIVFDYNDTQILGDFDYNRLEQVILNILSNAVKYTEKNGEIYIVLKPINNSIYLLIKDNGIGIPSKDLDRIFERFYRVDKARSRDMGGTGLGLAIAKEIIELHDGSIDIRSTYKEGTEVEIVLPLKM